MSQAALEIGGFGSRSSAALLANSIHVETLACRCEVRHCSNPRNYFSGKAMFQIADVSASTAHKVYVRFDVGIEPCLPMSKRQFLNQAELAQDAQSLVHRRQTDSWIRLSDLPVGLLRSRMSSIVEHKSANSYPLRGCLVSPPAEGLNYLCIRQRLRWIHTKY